MVLGSASQLSYALADNSSPANTTAAESPAEGDVSTPEAAAQAEGTGDSAPATQTFSLSGQQTDETAAPDSQNEETVAGDIAGVALQVSAALPLKRDVVVTARLTGEGTDLSRTATLPAANADVPTDTGTLHFDGLANGTYTLRVSADGFADYEQTIQVQDLVYTVQLYTDFLVGMSYDSAAPHPGVLRAGDVTGDGAITDADVTALVDALGTDAVACDLDGNGTVDLVDLQMLAANYQDTSNGTAVPTTRLSEALAAPAVAQGTEIIGSADDLLTGESSVQLKPQNSQAISEQNPVEVAFDFSGGNESTVDMQGLVLKSPAGSANAVTGGDITIEYEENGETKTMTIPMAPPMARALAAQVQADGTIVVDFGGQIAVKKVTILITATSQSTNLSDITQVEFLNDMESRIPAPQMDIPANLSAETGSKTFTLRWDAAVNVTGYEVEITCGGKTETSRTAAPTLTVTRFDGKKLVNKTEYTVRVRSINGEWRSPYGEALVVVPVADELPPAPDALQLTGATLSIRASWKAMEDTDTYNLYYRKQGDADFTKIEGIGSNSYTLTGLSGGVRYEVYVTGVNELGEGPASLTASASTTSVAPVNMPNYRLLNIAADDGTYTTHITAATHLAGYMKDSPLDKDNTAWGVLDGDFASWYGLNDWDDGATYPDNGGIRVTFDEAQNIGYLSLAQIEERGYYGNVRLYAHNESGQEYEVPGVTISKRSDGVSRNYYLIKIAGGVTTDYLRVCIGYTYENRPVSISELRFHSYDSLEDDILALYADDLHVTLVPTVDEETIEALQARLDTPDEASGEYHPDREALQRELDNARGLLENQLSDAVQVHTTITAAKDTHLGFTGLNAWQPLGVSAYAGEELVLYVGGKGGQTGSVAPLQLIATQFNAESGSVNARPIALKYGRNEISVPELVSFDAEHGGALYVQYTGNDATAQLSVRVGGGVKVPVLDLYGITDSGERLARVTQYVAELESYVASLPELHETLHAGSGVAAIDHGYNAEECILNTSDILLDQMMLSVPPQQILAGLSGADTAAKANQLLDSMDAMDQMMILFYQHKGLTDLRGAGDRNRLPSQHLNIRYQRMFAGAFMYAAGNHIGIGWGSVPGLAQGSVVQLDENGRYASGSFFGWGIAHEIGHNINQSLYDIAEVTNNYFAQLSQSSEGVRFGYDAIYRRVTSGVMGHSDDVFTDLAMYWQLHLAFDKGYEYQIYDDYFDLLWNRFYARVDTFARTPSVAPTPGNVPLTLGGNVDQNFMRLACAAAESDLTDFFLRWGLQPDSTTAAYAAQFPAETRALYYINDDARDYAMTHDAGTSIAGQDVGLAGSSVSVSEQTPNQVELDLVSTVDADLLLGYEITRITYANGQPSAEVVGFTTSDHYTDTITTLNNRTVTYEIAAVDKFLNRSQSVSLPTVKISHDGSYDKSLWTVSTNMVSDQDSHLDAGEHDPCEPTPVAAIDQVIDNDKSTTYIGRAQSGQAVVTLDFHKVLGATAFKYTVTEGSPIESYEVQISPDGSQWITVASGSFASQEVNTVYFRNENNDPWVCTYDAMQLRLIVTAPAGADIAISELDVLGPTGDNVELTAEGIGYLTDDLTYAEGEAIPQGSLVFTGSYKGNPAYNVVLLFDENGNIVGGLDDEGNLVANQIILAPDPENGELGEVSEGYWIYWIEPEYLPDTLPGSVRAELYRVDNATTNEGQRLTADTMPVALPDTLPGITPSGVGQ